MLDRFDPRERGDQLTQHEIYGRQYEQHDRRDRDGDRRDTERAHTHDPREVFVRGLDLPRGDECEVVLDARDRAYELDGEDARTLAVVGAFRVVTERDLPDPRDLAFDARNDDRNLERQGLLKAVPLDGRDRVVTLTDRGRRLLEAHRRDRGPERRQAFHAGISRRRELTHDASLYRAYREAEARLREQGAEVTRVVLEVDLKREYQEWLQANNRGRSDSDGRPDRSEREVESWAREHDLPYFDGSVHFPDFRIEYEVDGRDRHEDIEVVTEHYRGGHAAGRAQTGFTCYGSGGRRGGRSALPGIAEDLI